eukprot:scaffold70379_cov65-Phaeocystis_antarctica.AAC.4
MPSSPNGRPVTSHHASIGSLHTSIGSLHTAWRYGGEADRAIRHSHPHGRPESQSTASSATLRGHRTTRTPADTPTHTHAPTHRPRTDGPARDRICDELHRRTTHEGDQRATTDVPSVETARR